MFYHFLVSHLLGVLVFIPPLPNTAIVLFTIQHGSADSGSLTGCLRSPLSSAGTSICPRLLEPNVCPSQVTSRDDDTGHQPSQADSRCHLCQTRSPTSPLMSPQERGKGIRAAASALIGGKAASLSSQFTHKGKSVILSVSTGAV